MTKMLKSKLRQALRLKHIINNYTLLLGLLLSSIAVTQVASAQESIARPLADERVSSELVQGIEAALKKEEGLNCAEDPGPSDCRTHFREAITVKPVVLSPSGQRGLMVEISLFTFCGSGGCSVYIFKQDGKTYKEILSELGDIDSFVFAKTVTDGFYDVTVNGGSIGSPLHTKYIWNGSEYVLTPEEADAPAR
jgi:hypothetical protein